MEEKTFKEMIVELNGIVDSLESGTLELEQSLAEYEKGSKLLAQLKDKIQKAEEQVKKLSDQTDESSGIEVQEEIVEERL